MKKNIVLLILSCLVVLALVLASCRPAVIEEEEKEVPVVEEEEVPVVEEEEEEVVPAEEKPRYGGVLNVGRALPPVIFDDAFGNIMNGYTVILTSEGLLRGDWSKGPADAGETTWIFHTFPASHLLAGCLAESWEMPDATTIVYHIRKGVRFHDKPPTNGREMDANDVLFSMKRLWETPTSYHYKTYPWKTHIESLTAPDKWTIVLKCIPGMTGMVFQCVPYMRIVPHEVVEKYGNLGDWRNSCGTGPFMLTDYVSDSSTTFKKNPNYWGRDPVHPENPLPYLDGVKHLIIPDPSTQMAALRTGKIDWLGTIGWEDAGSLIITNPELKWIKYANSNPPAVYMRVDAEPLNDIRVRQALLMAVDNEAIKKDFYGGQADLLAWPLLDSLEWQDMYIPLNELPESTRELYEYHPEKARQLLAEAGYPGGFETEVVCIKSSVELLSIVKAYWADIGIDLELDVREYGAYISSGLGKTHKQMFAFAVGASYPFKLAAVVKGHLINFSMVDDPFIQEAYDEINDAFFDEPKRRRLLKELVPYMLEQAYLLQTPAPSLYTFWEPWVKGYHGEYEVGYSEWGNFPIFIWLDQDMREARTGRK